MSRYIRVPKPKNQVLVVGGVVNLTTTEMHTYRRDGEVIALKPERLELMPNGTLPEPLADTYYIIGEETQYKWLILNDKRYREVLAKPERYGKDAWGNRLYHFKTLDETKIDVAEDGYSFRGLAIS